MNLVALFRRLAARALGALPETRVKCLVITPQLEDFFDALIETRRAGYAAERRAAVNGAWAIAFFGLLATSWEAALLWLLPK